MSRSSPILSLQTVAALAAGLLAAASATANAADQRCGAGTCGKKTVQGDASKTAPQGKKKKDEKKAEQAAPAAEAASMPDASCGSRDASCGKKDAACSKKPDAS
ncbi:hypothetical protein BTL55_00905 [Bordetella trematum]|uniref:hypothetical protein n=1 Tax=Bordetella trematum TaxID=123899 RepID=UPI000C76009A|nr:hypothetical protein [Bordetella trematum]AUL45687.1 hypothetical protein BTL55_00905 [Bordetella trematum]